jgi:hypothetical protein
MCVFMLLGVRKYTVNAWHFSVGDGLMNECGAMAA